MMMRGGGGGGGGWFIYKHAGDDDQKPHLTWALLKRVLRIQADCEIGGPHLYVTKWLLAAPSADDQWMLAKVAGEEIDHFRKINRLLNELGEDASDLMYVEKSRRDLEAFRQTMPTWADVAAFGFLIDRVGQYQLEEFVGCSYRPLDRALPRILQEEKTHVGYGHVKLRDMVRTEEGRAEAQAAIDRWYPRAHAVHEPEHRRLGGARGRRARAPVARADQRHRRA